MRGHHDRPATLRGHARHPRLHIGEPDISDADISHTRAHAHAPCGIVGAEPAGFQVALLAGQPLWESDESDDTTPQSEPEQPATEQPEAPPGVKYDASGKLIDAEPHSREARYRTQLRATELERDQLRERLENRDKAEVEHLVANRLIDPKDLWAAGVSLPDVTDPDSGDISPQLIDECLERVVKEHPHWRFNPAAPASAVSFGAEKPDLTQEQQPTWQGVFQQATQPR